MFWGSLQALSCPSHPQRVVPTLSSRDVHSLSRFLISLTSLSLPSSCSSPLLLPAHPLLVELCPLQAQAQPAQEPSSSADWALPTPISASFTMGTEKPPGPEPQQRLGQIWMGLACYLPSLPCFFACSWRVPSVLKGKAFQGRSVLQDVNKKNVHEPTELSRAGIFTCERIFHKQNEKPISLCMFGAWD